MMKTELVNGALVHTAEAGRYLDAQECHKRWLDHRLTIAEHKQRGAMYERGAKREKMLDEVSEILKSVRDAHFQYTLNAKRQEYRLATSAATVERHRNRLADIERRDPSNRLSGYAAVFHRAGDPGTQYALSPHLMERVAPGAFDDAINNQKNVYALWSHNPDEPLFNHRPTVDTNHTGFKELNLGTLGLNLPVYFLDKCLLLT